MPHWRKHLIFFAILALIGAAINFPIAVRAILSNSHQRQPASIDLRGSAAATRSYPEPTPADQPAWPPPTTYQVYSDTFAHKRIDARSTPANSTATMVQEVQYYGWPLPVLYDAQMWWDWNNPQWKSKVDFDPALSIYWSGALLNPLLFAAAIWTLIFAPAFVIRRARAFIRLRIVRSRHRKGLCPTCAYPIPPNTPCPECGHGTAPA